MSSTRSLAPVAKQSLKASLASHHASAFGASVLRNSSSSNSSSFFSRTQQSRSLTSVASAPPTVLLHQTSRHRNPSLRPTAAAAAGVVIAPQKQQQSRSIFIQTQDTPNQDALKFLPSGRVLPAGLATPFVEYLSPRSTLAPPHPSPLASRLLAVDGVTAVFYGPDYITVTKASDVPWAHVKPEVFSLITEAVTSGQPMVNVTSGGAATGAGGEDGAAAEQAGGLRDSLEHNEEDDEVVQMIKELLDTRIRPAIQEDGGDIEFRGFEDGKVLLKLRGACRTCDSSTVTLRNGIENMLMHYIEEVKGVTQVLDEEEEIALKEFAKFEEKLKAQRGEAAVASTGGKGTLDTAEA